MFLQTRAIVYATCCAGLMIATTGCAGRTPGSERPISVIAEENAIREARLQQNAAMDRGDVDSVASFWTEDVTLRRGLGQPVSGRDAYRQLFAADRTAEQVLYYRRRTLGVDVSPQWPLAFETGTWTAHVGRPDGREVIAGRYSAQWVRRERRWLIRSEVFVALTCADVGCRSTAAP